MDSSILSASLIERYFSSCDVDSVDLSVENSIVLTRFGLSDVLLDLNFDPYLLGLREGMSMNNRYDLRPEWERREVVSDA